MRCEQLGYRYPQPYPYLRRLYICNMYDFDWLCVILLSEIPWSYWTCCSIANQFNSIKESMLKRWHLAHGFNHIMFCKKRSNAGPPWLSFWNPFFLLLADRARTVYPQLGGHWIKSQRARIFPSFGDNRGGRCAGVEINQADWKPNESGKNFVGQQPCKASQLTSLKIVELVRAPNLRMYFSGCPVSGSPLDQVPRLIVTI